jgi:hypothetical protein
MRLLSAVVAAVWACGTAGWAARCTTVVEPGALREYQSYVAAAESSMAARFARGELSWVPEVARSRAAADLAAGKLVRWNIGDAGLNRRIASKNATVLHWAGAIRIHHTSLAELRTLLEDYDRYASIYQPMIFECHAERSGAGTYEVAIGLHNQYRYASLFPQHYSFRVKGRIEYEDGPALLVHLRSDEIRESDSGVPGRTDFLEPYHDHGILWALNSWWRARQQGPDLYLEFETITLARSVEEFVCKLGFLPVPKSLVAGAMDSIPAESIEVMLVETKAECERRTTERAAGASRE